MLIFTDLDGVIYRGVHDGVLKWVNKEYNVFMTHSYFTSWDLFAAFGIPNSRSDELWSYVWKNPGDLYGGAKRFLERLTTDQQHRVIGLTRRQTGPALNALHFQLERDQLPFETVINVEEWEDKDFHIKYHKPKVYIEDNLAFLRKAPPGPKYLLFHQPWNQSADLDVNYTRVFSYEDILDIIEEM